MNKSSKVVVVLALLFSQFTGAGLAKTNILARAAVVLSASGASAVGPTHIITSGCWSTNIIASGVDYVECSDDNSPGWGPAATIAPAWNYSTIAGSQWIDCPAQLNDGATFQATFELPPNFSNPSLSIQLYADNAATVKLNGALVGQQPQGIYESNFQAPATQFNVSGPFYAGTNVLTIYNMDYGVVAGIDFVASISYQPGLPIMQWIIKDGSGAEQPKSTTEGYMSLTADGLSQAIVSVINTAEVPTFTLTALNGAVDTTLTNTPNGAVVYAGTNFGTVMVSGSLTNNSCYTTNFYFDLGSCQSCKNGDKCAVQANINSLDIRIDLGPSRLALGQAFLQVKSEVPNPAIATPALLHSDFIRPEIQNITNSSGSLRQVAALDRIVDILTNSATSYSLYFYDPTNVVSHTNGLYQFGGTAFRTVTIQLLSGNTNQVRLSDSLDPNPSDYVWQGTGWSLITGSGLRTETKTATLVGAISTRVRTIQNAQSVTQSTTTETWQTFSFGYRLTQEIFGSGANARTNTYSYNTNGLLDTVTRYDGSWDKYQYDSLGRQVAHYSAFTNSAPTTNSSLCRLTSSTYTNSVVSGSGDDWTLDRYTPRQVTDLVLGTEVSRRYTVVQAGLRMDIQCVNPGATWSDSSNLFTTNYLRTDFEYFGQPSKTIRPDGTMQLFSYDVQPLPAMNWPILKKTTVWTGAPSGYTNVIDGTLQETWVDAAGRTILELETDIASSIIVSSNFYSYDSGGHLTSTTYLDGTKVSQTYDCCRLGSTTGRDGTVTSYAYDALNRQIATTQAGIKTSNVLDSVGNILSIVRYGTDGTSITNQQATYNDGGDQTSSRDGLSNLTTYTNFLDATSQFVRQTTYPDLTTRIETYARDGSLMKVSGTAVHGIRYEYGLISDGGFQRRYTKEIKLDNSGNDTTEWTRTVTDGAGRAYKMLYSDANFTQSFFNNQGQLIKQRDPDGVYTLSQYNARGQVEYTALDLNTNGVIDFGGSDRITRSASDVVNNPAFGANVNRTRTWVWSSNSSSVSNLISASESSADGLYTWQTTYPDPSTVITNRSDTCYAGSGYRYQTNTASDGSYTVSQFQFGRLASVVQKDSQNNQVSAATYSYDAHGRQQQVIDARNGATVYAYNNADLMTSVSTAMPGNGQNKQTTSTSYNNRQQVTGVVAADGGTTTYEYYTSGELKRTFGTRTYPVAYSYDYAGRVKTMTNWISFSSGLGARVTTWNYNTNRGWLDNKRYADNQGPDYTYTAGGRLRTRTWARIGTSSARISTTYTYGFNDGSANDEHGDLLSVTYANDPQSTPSVTFTYDRRGRTSTVARNSITTTLAYNDAGQLLSQTNSGGTLNSWWVANTFDPLMRRTNLQVKAGGTLNASFSYGYDNASRLQTVTDGTNNATYAYLANSPLVSQITFKSNTVSRMTLSKTYDFLNRLTQISSAPAAGAALSFNYRYNDANQRVQVLLADGSFWLYEYDSLGQVMSGKKYWSDWTPVAGQQFEYTHDDIGNRSQTKAGGDQNGANVRVATYSVNNLNQYTNRTVPGAVDVMGIASAGATVTVNNQAAYRKVEFYRSEVAINNTSAPQWQAITNKAVQGSTTNTATGNVFLPKTPEVFIYDADGNLLSDGRWTNSWDAENRLITMKGLSTVPNAANLLLNFEYDWQGRRIRKKVSTYNGSTYTLSTDTKAIWDGWNCVVEPNGSDAVQRRYMWGLDLSGSEQGAGGVGGLLAVRDVSGGTGVHFAGYDGNGNVAMLAKANDGTVSANYEYGPFGELLRATGPIAKANPFRFSTKYQDEETDLVYYGVRYLKSSTGGWLSRDPISEGGGLNLYGFVNNDPIGNADVLGEWNRGVHYVKTVEWSGNAGFGPSYAAMIGEADNGTDSGGTSWWPIFGQEDRHLNFPSHHGMDSRDWWYNLEYKTAVNFLQAADQSGSTHLCAYAAQAFGRAMHSRQDRSAHRNWPGGGDWSPWIAHPGWWDSWTDDEMARSVHEYPSEMFWKRWFQAKGGPLYDTFEGLGTATGSAQRDLQVAARQKVTTESRAAISDFIGEVRKTCVCRREMLLNP